MGQRVTNPSGEAVTDARERGSADNTMKAGDGDDSGPSQSVSD